MRTSVCARCAAAGLARCVSHIPAAVFDPPGRWLFLFGDLRPPPMRDLFGDLFHSAAGELIDDAIAALGPGEFLWLAREPGSDLTIVWPGAVRLSTEGGDPL